jgi:hypothetical protein
MVSMPLPDHSTTIGKLMAHMPPNPTTNSTRATSGLDFLNHQANRINSRNMPGGNKRFLRK